MTKICCVILLTCFISSCDNSDKQKHVDLLNYNNSEKTMEQDFDYLDAYKLTIGKTFLYGSYDSFINQIGIPKKLTIVKKDFAIISRADLDKAVATAINTDIVTFHYPGIDMWYGYDNNILPYTVDFRKTENVVTYGNTTFDQSYSLEKFKEQFPISFNSPHKFSKPFFEMMTKEKGSNFTHYILKRKSKDDPSVEPMIEFTFDKDKLIFIFFANF